MAHRHDQRLVLGIAAVLLLASLTPRGRGQEHESTTAETGRRPHILLILADDLGYGDLGCTGSRHLRTPHLDVLANGGAFARWGVVASPVCSPSRAGLLTGRDPRRFGYQDNLNAAANAYATQPTLLGLPPSERTFADHLRAGGYATALVGKWHQGTGDGFHPNTRGFDHFCGMLGGSHGYFPTPDKHSIERNGARVEAFSSPYLTDFFTDEGERWIRDRHAHDASQPWCLFMSYNAPHTPMHATEEDLARFSHIEDDKRRTYAAMVYALDRGVGRLMALLERLELRDDTLVVFLSDNGGATNNASWNGPLSGAKGCLREGGVRVPMIWSWPGHVPAGTDVHHPVSSLDLLPTFMAAAGLPLPPLPDTPKHEDRGNRGRATKQYGAYDGTDVLPWLMGTAEPTTRTLFWRLQGQAAVLHGPHKLIRLSHRPAQLFHVEQDVAESIDLVLERTDVRNDLFTRLSTWESTLPTVPLWGSSPRWHAQSARIYDTYIPRPEPR